MHDRAAERSAADDAVCVSPGGNVTGPLTVAPGGMLDIQGGRITGPLTVNGASFLRICGATITGPLTITGSTGLVLVGGDAATGPCAANTITGPVSVTGNTAGAEVNGNRISARSRSPATPAACRRPTPAPRTRSATTSSGR